MALFSEPVMGQPSDCLGQTSKETDNEVRGLANRAYRCEICH